MTTCKNKNIFLPCQGADKPVVSFPRRTFMSSGEVQSVFAVEEEPNFPTDLREPITAANTLGTESPSDFLNNLQVPQAHAPATAEFTEAPGTNSFPKPAEFMPAISPSLMLSSMATSSAATENLLASAKERLNQIRPWKDFFSIDQFRIPESSTAAQSRASHNFTHFQNNYLIILLLFSAFSL